MHQVRKGKYLDFTSAAVGLLSPQAVIEKQVMQHGGKLFFFFLSVLAPNTKCAYVSHFVLYLFTLFIQILLSSSAVLQIGLSVAFASSLHTVSHS